MLEDCEAATTEIAPPKPTDVAIVNNASNKIHRALVYGEEFHPRHWKTRCSWHFRNNHTDFSVVEMPKQGWNCCLKCFPEFRANTAKTFSESSDSPSTSS